MCKATSEGGNLWSLCRKLWRRGGDGVCPRFVNKSAIGIGFPMNQVVDADDRLITTLEKNHFCQFIIRSDKCWHSAKSQSWQNRFWRYLALLSWEFAPLAGQRGGQLMAWVSCNRRENCWALPQKDRFVQRLFETSLDLCKRILFVFILFREIDFKSIFIQKIDNCTATEILFWQLRQMSPRRFHTFFKLSQLHLNFHAFFKWSQIDQF